MSKGNLFLGLATGKIGSVVLYRAFGEERARSWVATKRNPRTWRQAVQRCLMKTAQVAYSSLMPLCRSSFQGFDPGTPSQAAFISRNLRVLRGRVQADIDAGREAVLESAVGNYNGASGELFLANPLMVSDGGLPPVGATPQGSRLYLQPPPSSLVKPVVTYRDVCQAYGFGEGDALHLLLCSFRPSGELSGMQYAVVVLRPSSGDMSAPIALESGGEVNLPNAGNVGGPVSVSWSTDPDDIERTFSFLLPVPASGDEVAGAVVRSRVYGSLVQWSPEFLVFNGRMPEGSPLGAAVASFMTSSDVYLDGG